MTCNFWLFEFTHAWIFNIWHITDGLFPSYRWISWHITVLDHDDARALFHFFFFFFFSFFLFLFFFFFSFLFFFFFWRESCMLQKRNINHVCNIPYFCLFVCLFLIYTGSIFGRNFSVHLFFHMVQSIIFTSFIVLKHVWKFNIG